MAFFNSTKQVKIYYNYTKNTSKKKNCPTLLFLHGLGSDHSSWTSYINYFKKTNNILTLDLRGYGKSTRPKNSFQKNNRYQIKNFTSDIHKLITKLKITNLTIIGHSFGGVLAHYLANKLYTKKIILISTPISKQDVSFLFILQLHLANLIPQKIFQFLEPKQEFHKIKYKIPFCIKCLAKTPAKVALNIIKELNKEPKQNKTNKTKLVIISKNDEVVKNKIKNIYKVKEIKGKHLSFLTNKKIAINLIEDFISNNHYQTNNLKLATIKQIFNKHNLENIKNFKKIASGVSNPVYSINNKYILRIKNDNIKHKFQKETYLYNLIKQKTKLPVPKTIAINSSKDIIPNEYMITTKLPGKTLKQTVPSLNNKLKQNLAKELGTALAQLHSIKFKHSGQFSIKNKSQNFKKIKAQSWSRNIQKDYTKALKTLKSNNLLNKTLINKIKNMLKTNKHLLNIKFVPSLIHSDFNSENILIHKNKISAIIDYEWSFSGHSEYDLGTIQRRLFQAVNLNDQKQDFFKAYEKIIKRPKNKKEFEQLYGILSCLKIISWLHTEKITYPKPDKYIKEINRLLNT